MKQNLFLQFRGLVFNVSNSLKKIILFWMIRMLYIGIWIHILFAIYGLVRVIVVRSIFTRLKLWVMVIVHLSFYSYY